MGGNSTRLEVSSPRLDPLARLELASKVLANKASSNGKLEGELELELELEESTDESSQAWPTSTRLGSMYSPI